MVQAKERILAPNDPQPDPQALAAQLLACRQGGGVLNTAYMERFNATMCACLASLGRRSRCLVRQMKTLETGMYLAGCVYNFCTWHESLRVPLYVLGSSGAQRRWAGRTPAMSAGLTDHRWSLAELLRYPGLSVSAAAVQGHKVSPKTTLFARAA